jgi:hypothetical protein
MHFPNRRQILQQMGAVGGASLLAPSVSFAGPKFANPIQLENAKPGDQRWKLDKTKIDPQSKYRCPWIEGYCSHSSISAGETLQIFVSTAPASRFTLQIYRLGYYGGEGGRLVKDLSEFEGAIQAEPPVGDKRLRQCDWKPSVEFAIPEDWLSGVYVGKLAAKESGIQSYVIFIVKDSRKCDLLFQCSDNTWQAYNRWPSQFALYDDGKSEWYWGRGVQVSYRRPYGKYCQIFDAPLSTGSGEFFLWEFPFAYWLEQHGYDVSYVSNLDTHRDPKLLDRCKGFLSVGHDEYWTIEMFRNVQSAIQRGTGVGFFSGNAVCGRIEFNESLTAFERVGVFGPPGGTQEFASMSSLKHERPYANELIGAHSTGPVTGGADWICTAPEHWLYEGTGMKQGDAIAGLIGWEWHGDPAKIPGLEVVSTGPTQSAPGKPNGGTYTGTVYYGPKSNVVFNAATCWWADGLSAPPGYARPSVYTSPKGPDPRVQRMTANVLKRLIDR